MAMSSPILTKSVTSLAWPACGALQASLFLLFLVKREAFFPFCLSIEGLRYL